MNDWIDIAALLKVLAVGLLGGVGLVALFTLGLAGLSSREGAMAAGPDSGGRAGGLAPLALAVVCFGAVVAGIVLGILSILG